jgi:NAD(P)H-dependent FMN reductase
VGAEGEAVSGTAATTDKPVALLSSSPGAFGGMRALALVRQFLSGTFQMLVLPQQMALGRAHGAFGADGALQDSRQSQTLAQISNALVTHAKRRV